MKALSLSFLYVFFFHIIHERTCEYVKTAELESTYIGHDCQTRLQTTSYGVRAAISDYLPQFVIVPDLFFSPSSRSK